MKKPDIDINTDIGLDALPVTRVQLAGLLTGIFALLLGVLVLVAAPPIWGIALIAMVLGFIPGILLFPWVTSPFGPGLWVLSGPFARIHYTISQVIRRQGVLVKRASDEYEHATYLPDEEVALCADGTRISIDEGRTTWGWFGKRRLGVTWEFGTSFYDRITAAPEDDSGEAAADGSGGRRVSLNAAHRMLRGVNEADVISRTEEKAEAEYGGGGSELGGLTMAMLVALMLLLGSFTTFFML